MFGAKKPDFSALGKNFIDKMSKGTGTSVATTGGGSNALVKQDVSPLATMKEMFADMRDSLQSIQNNTLETVELLKVAVMGTEQQQKQDKIKAGDVDGKEKGPGILSRAAGGIKSAVSFLTPESGGLMSTLLKLGLAVGAIALIKIFGDKAVGPLGNLIKAFKEGTIGEKIGEIVTDIQEYLTPLWTNIKIKTGEFIAGVQTVFGLIEGAYKSIKEFMMQYDTGGAGPGGRYADGKLDAQERQAMFSDIITRIKDAVFGFAGDLVTGLVSAIGLITVAGIFSRLGPGVVAAGGAGLGVFGVAALGLVAAAGIYSLYDRIQFAFNEELDATPVPDNMIDKSSNVAAKFLGGKDPKGGVINAMDNAMTMGLIGAVLGGIAGSLFFGIGAVPGAAIGFRIGTLLGAGFGLIGSDELKKDMPSMAHFNENTDKLASIITGRETEKDTNMDVLTKRDTELTKNIADAEINVAKSNIYINRKILKDLKKSKVKNDLLIKNQAENLANRMSKGGITEIDNQIYAEKERLKNIKFGMSSAGNYDQTQIDDALGPDGFIAEAEENIKFLEQDRKELLLKYQNSSTSASSIGTKTSMELDEIVKQNQAKILALNSKGTSTSDKPIVIAGNNNDSSIKSQTSNSVFAGLTVGNPYSTAVLTAQQVVNHGGR